jgi:hypothetical protein
MDGGSDLYHKYSDVSVVRKAEPIRVHVCRYTTGGGCQGRSAQGLACVGPRALTASGGPSEGSPHRAGSRWLPLYPHLIVVCTVTH